MKAALLKIWWYLTRPSPALDSREDRLVSRLLASLLVAIVPMGPLILALAAIANRRPISASEDVPVNIVASGLWIVAYGLVRSRYFRIGAAMTAAVAMAQVAALALVGGDWEVLGFLMMPVLFSSLVFSIRVTHFVAGACLLELVALPLLFPASIRFSEIIFGVAMVMVGSGIAFLSANHRNRREALQRAELALQEARYRAIVEDQEELIIRCAPDGKLTFVNDAYCRFFAQPREAVLGRPVPMPVSDAEAGGVAASVVMLSPESPIAPIEACFRRGDGQSRWLHGSVRAIYGDDGQVVEYQGVGHDVTDRRAAQDALQESERLFRSIFEQAPVGIHRTTPDGRILLANPEMISMLGCRSLAELAAHGVDGEDFGSSTARADAMARLAETGAVHNVESVWRSRDGSPVYVRESARLISDADGRPLYYEGAARDVTAEKQAQQALHEHARFLASLNEITQSALEASGLAETLDVVAHRLRDIFGADSCYITLWDEAQQATIPAAAAGAWHGRYDRLTPTHDRQTLTASVLSERRALAIEDNRNSPYLDPRVAEEFPDRSLLGLPFLAGDQKLGAALLGCHDRHIFSEADIARGEQISRHISLAIRNALLREQVESYAATLEARVEARTAELGLERARLRAILNSAAEGIVVTDGQGRVEQTNPVAQRWLSQALLPGDAEMLRMAIRSLVGGSGGKGEVVDLTGIDLQLAAAPIEGADRGDAFVVSINDVTHIKAMTRMHTEFIHNVSHELRTPAATLKLYAHLLPTAPEDRRARYEQALQEEADHLTRLIEDVVQLSALDAGQMVLNRRVIDLNELMRAHCARIAPLAEEAGLRLTTRAVPEAVTTYADPARIDDVLSQVLRNAIAYTPRGGVIRVATARIEADDRHWVTLTVGDTGVGIPPDELPHLFEPFFRGAWPQQAQISGTGLGLTIVYALVELHGGKITVGASPDGGATFTIWLPRALADAAAP